MGTIPIRALALLIASLVLGSACEGDRGPGGRPLGSTSKLEAGAPCSVPEECRFGLSCDAARRICVCTSDASCPGAQKCNQFTGTCMDEVPGCSVTSPCASDQWCDLATRVCAPLRPFCAPCGRDEDCGTGNRCIRGGDGKRVCGKACVADGDCPSGASCMEGQCTPPVKGCASLAKCTPDTLKPCSSTTSCPEDQFCEPAMRVCVARQSGCAPGFACQPDRECVPACTSDDSCGDDERCVNALCRKKDRCKTDGTCSAGKVCREDPVSGDLECVPTCKSTADCPVGEICETVGGKRACRPGCMADADCPPDARCDVAQKTCDRSPGRCQLADVCGACEECRAGTCRFAFDDAFPNRRYCAPCASTGPDADCGLGGFCIDGRCAPPCPEDGCPKGFICQTLADAGGTAYGQGCFPADGRCDTECL